MLKTAWSFLARDFLIAISYPAAFAAQVGGIVVRVAAFYYMGAAIGSSSEFLKPYGGSFFAFLVVGMAFVDYVAMSLQSFAASIRDGQMVGTLEMLLVSPLPAPVIILASSLWSYIFYTVLFGIFFGVSTVIFGLQLGEPNIGGAICVMLLSILYLMGLGIIGAGLVLVGKQERVFTGLMVFSTVLLGGVAYPVEVLPAWLGSMADVLPFTHSVTALRQAVLMDYSWTQLAPELMILAAYAVVLLPLGSLVFTVCLKRVKINGTLSHY